MFDVDVGTFKLRFYEDILAFWGLTAAWATFSKIWTGFFSKTSEAVFLVVCDHSMNEL